MESLFPRVRKSLSHLVLPTRTKQYIQNPRNLMAPALHRSESVMELGTKRCLLRQNISLLDMGDTLGVCFVLVFCLEQFSKSLIFLYQPWSLLRGQRSQDLTCAHPRNI